MSTSGKPVGTAAPATTPLVSLLPSVDYRAAFVASILAPVLMLSASLMHIISGIIQYSSRSSVDFELYKQLNATLLSEMWVARRAAEPVALIGEFIDVLAWFALIPPVLCLVEIIGRRRSTSMVVISSFFAGSISAAIALLNQAGTESVSAFMSTWSSMDAEHHHDGGFGALQALEVRFGCRVRTSLLHLFARKRGARFLACPRLRSHSSSSSSSSSSSHQLRSTTWQPAAVTRGSAPSTGQCSQ